MKRPGGRILRSAQDDIRGCELTSAPCRQAPIARARRARTADPRLGANARCLDTDGSRRGLDASRLPSSTSPGLDSSRGEAGPARTIGDDAVLTVRAEDWETGIRATPDPARP